MRVKVRRERASQPMEFTDVTNAYEKGSFYCIYTSGSNQVRKIPIADIFDVVEEYNDTDRNR